MKAVRFHTHGGPDVLRVEVLPDPVPRAGAALVRVRACALNHLDLWGRRGIPGVTIPLPHVPGSDMAGEVVSTPSGLPAPGTRVMVQPGSSCGRCAQCLAGRDNYCPEYDLLGYRTDGGYAELVTVPAQNLVPLPDEIDFIAAAAFPLTFLTAWHMLVTRARLALGETVLVLAAGSGVGQAAIQVARALGARVLATAGTEEKRTRAVAIGAEAAFDHRADTFADDVRRYLAGAGVDIVIEHVGEATWQRSLRCLARGGRLVTCGATSGPRGAVDLRWLFARQISVLGSFMGGKGELWDVARLFFDGRLAPVVDRTYPLDEAADAHRRLESGQQFGKIVLIC